MTEITIAIKAVQIYAEMHPRPPHVTQAQAAEMLGRSRPTIARMIKSGTLKLNRCGLIPISEVDRALEAMAA